MKKLLCMMFAVGMIGYVFSIDIEQPGSVTRLTPVSTVLIPKEFFVGDDVEYRCTFQTELRLLPDGIGNVAVQPDIAVLGAENMTIRQIQLQQVAGGYELCIFFIPWQAGQIVFPEITFDIFPAVSETLLPDTTVSALLPAITVSSLVEKLQETELRPPSAPILLPGTIYIVYICVICGLLVLLGIIMVCIRFRRVMLFFHNLVIRFKHFRNYRQTLCRLKKLLGSDCSHKEFAAGMEMAVREYLQIRFSYPFFTVTTAELMGTFDAIFAGVLSSGQQDNIESLWGILYRCDVIRFSPGTEMEPDERKELVTRLQQCLCRLEKEGRE